MTKPTSDRLDAYFVHLAAVSPPALRVWTAANETEFCAAVEDAVHATLFQIEAGARQYAVLEERGLSLLLAQLLAAGSLSAVAEGYHNGHVDVTVSHPAGLTCAMLGECKLYDGFRHHCEGCEQLLKRYTSGRSPRAFCLDFINKPGMYEKLKKLREEFDAKRPLDQLDNATDHRIKGAFVTAHKHFTAAVVEVLHLGCNVYHPEAVPPGPQEQGTDG